MEARIRQLQALLKTAEVDDGHHAPDGTVRLGVVVALRYEGDADDDVQRYFVGSIEERGDLPVASPSSPLGQAAPRTVEGRRRRVRRTRRDASRDDRRRRGLTPQGVASHRRAVTAAPVGEAGHGPRTARCTGSERRPYDVGTLGPWPRP